MRAISPRLDLLDRRGVRLARLEAKLGVRTAAEAVARALRESA